MPAPATRSDNLALLYQGVLTGIVRLQSGRQPLTEVAAFQKRMKEVLADIEREAIKLGYLQEDISNTSYAVVAFLDEAVLNSRDPRAAQWVSLQAQMYHQAIAGEEFFEQIRTLRARRDAQQLADILEVYYLCLLLGYQGRFALGDKAELRQIMADLHDRIDTIRGRRTRLSPSALPAEPTPAVEPPRPPDTLRPLRLAALAAGVVLVAAWIVFRVVLSYQAGQLRTALQQMLVP
jgi:type VI secretion system protein ImpK